MQQSYSMLLGYGYSIPLYEMETIYKINKKYDILILFYKKQRGGEVTSKRCDMYEQIETKFWKIK